MKNRKTKANDVTIKPKAVKAFLASFPYHPLLFAVFPVLAFYAFNIQEVAISVLFKPLVTVLLVSLLAFLLLDLVFKNFYKTSIFLSLFVFIFFFHSHLHNLIGDQFFKSLPIPLGLDETLFLFWILLLTFILVFLVKSSSSLVKLTRVLNITSLILVAISLSNILSFEITTGRIFEKSSGASTINSEQKEGILGYKPDIYYLIFDRYTNNVALNKYFNFDNSDFINYLEDNNFIVLDKANTNYPKTLPSLASSLNLEYINDYITTTAIANNDETVLYPLMQQHFVGQYLQKQGYFYHHLGSWFEPTKTNEIADKNYVLQDVFLPIDSFSLKLLEITIIPPITRKVAPETSLSSFDVQHRNRVLYQFDRLHEIVDTPEPKFVFAHVLAPHEPYVFDSDCNHIKPTFSEEGERFEEVEYYNRQLQCINKKIEALVAKILRDSESPPVIIIQSDEGTSNYKSILNRSTNERKIEEYTKRFGIINALYLPKISNEKIPSDLTPVNTFRLIFNLYFGGKFDYLPNQYYYFQDGQQFLDLFEATELVKNL